MGRKKSYPTVTDQFCGAGGSGQGARNAGAEVKLALNHWKLATETYSTNNPDTDVECTDISASDPRRYRSTDGLITSPECTTHTPAGGNNHKTLKKQMDMFNSGAIDPATERSRATMWDVCRFAEYHNYNFIVVENVVEAKTRWVLFDDWLRAMHTLGYKHRCVYHNSMHHHPTPQSRDRMYVVFWKKGNREPLLDFNPIAFCVKCTKDIPSVQTWKKADVHYGKYKQQYVYCCPTCTSTVEPYYYASFNCIDWTDRGTRIGDRKKPLKPKTMDRIEFGRNKYANAPFQVQIAYSTTRGITRSISDPCYTQSTVAGSAIIQQPFIVNNQHSTGIGFRVKGSSGVVPTIQTTHQLNLVIAPFLTEMHSKGKTRPITEPLNSATAGGIKNGIVTTESWNSFIAQYYGGSHCVSHITDELGTVTTNDRSGLITYNKPDIEDFYYRMLKPPEIKMAMAFNHDYIILGTGKDQVKQCGNAVTPPVMEWLVKRCIESLN